jgi:hypothetical protein
VNVIAYAAFAKSQAACVQTAYITNYLSLACCLLLGVPQADVEMQRDHTTMLAAHLQLPLSVVRQLDGDELDSLQHLAAFLQQHQLEKHFVPFLRCCSNGKQLAERIELVDCFVGYIGLHCSQGAARAAWDEAMQLLWDVQQLHAYGRAGQYLPLLNMLLLAESPVQLQSQLQRVHALLTHLPKPNAALAATQAAAAAAKAAAVKMVAAAAAAEEAAAIRTAAAAAAAAAAATTAAAYPDTPAVVATSWHAAVPEAVVARAGLISAELATDLAEEYALYAPPKQQQQPASAAHSYSVWSSSSSSVPVWQDTPTAAAPAVQAAAATSNGSSSSSSKSRAASPFSAGANVAAAAAASMAAAGVDTTPEGPSYSSVPALHADEWLCIDDGLAGSSSSSGDFLSVTPQQRQSVPTAADSAAAAASAGISRGEVQVADTSCDSGADGGEITASNSSSSTGESVVFGEALVSGEPLVSEEPGRLSYDGPGTPAAVSVAASCAASPRPSYDGAGDDSSSSGGDVQLVAGGSKQQQHAARKGGMLRGVAGCMPVRLLLKGLTSTALLCRRAFGSSPGHMQTWFVDGR